MENAEGKLTSTNQLLANLSSRRVNRIPAIHGIFAIAQNTLGLEWVTMALNGKWVLDSPKGIDEAKVDDLLTAYGIMTWGW